jgi:hypothetical protein
MSTLLSGGNMAAEPMHNKLYKLAIRMNRVNGKGVKRNLDYLVRQVEERNKAHSNCIQQSLPIL